MSTTENTLKLTNLKQELIDNYYDFSLYENVEYVISEMIFARPNSPEEVAERTKDLVTMLQPEGAEAVFRRACSVAEARAHDIESGDYAYIETFDALLNGLSPWLKKQGYPDPILSQVYLKTPV